MRLENTENTIAEQIAKLALMRTGLVTLQEERSGTMTCDFVVYNQEQPHKKLYVEVKQINESNLEKNQVQEKYQSYINSLAEKSVPNTYIAFFIEGATEKGWFEIFDRGQAKGLERLRMDSLSTKLSELVETFTGVKYPPYSFYQRSEGKPNYKVGPFLIDNEYNYLRLINLTLTPIEDRHKIVVIVTIEQAFQPPREKKFHLNSLFYNPNLHNFLFFIDPITRREIGEIQLPPGNKYVSIQVKYDADIRKDFDMKLSCRFLKHQGEPNY